MKAWMEPDSVNHLDRIESQLTHMSGNKVATSAHRAGLSEALRETLRELQDAVPSRVHATTRLTLFARLLAPLFTSLQLTACDAPDVDLEAITTPPQNVTITHDLVTLAEGMAVAVRVHVDATPDPQTGAPIVTMTSANPQLVAVWPTTQENTFVIGGVAQGTTSLTIKPQGYSNHLVAVTITKQGTK